MRNKITNINFENNNHTCELSVNNNKKNNVKRRNQQQKNIVDNNNISSNSNNNNKINLQFNSKMLYTKKLLFTILYVCFINYVNGQDEKDQPLLFCQPNKMFIKITKSYLRKHNIEIKSAAQLYFRGHSGCFAQEENNDYVLSLFNPFDACGTELEHTSEDYIYTNEVVLDRRDGNGATKLLEMRCVYEDKYIVSSGPITPTKNTLTFTTEYGEFETKMSLYSNPRFDSMSKLDDRPSVQLGNTVYVAISMFVPFSPDYQNDFTITIKSCFANHNEDHTIMDTYHYLISGMCASPNDPTVSIYQNGQYGQEEARFSFDMFKFKQEYGDYLYLHCEVKLCNSTLEICNGDATGPSCNGRPIEKEEKRRKKRSTNGMFEITSNTMPLLSRNKREGFDDDNAMPDPVDDTLAYLSRGPLVLETPTKSNIADKSGLSVSLEEVRREQSFLRLWVFSGVAAVIGIIGILLTGVTIYKRRAERIKLQTNGTVITAPTLAKNNTPAWRQGPLPTIPGKNKDEDSGD